MTSPRIQPLLRGTLRQLDVNHYDAALASLGFEWRCREIPTAIGKVARRAAVPFVDRHEESYEDNARFFEREGWEVPAVQSESAAVRWIMDWLKDVGEDPNVRRVAVDVSSMSRGRIASVVEAVVEYLGSTRLDVDFLYTPAVFRAPDPADDAPLLSVDPVSGYFAGWWSDLDAPLHAIIGVGYELERAASAIDQLEPESVEVFIPVGTDERYLAAVRKANGALFKTNTIEPVTKYQVGDPFACFHVLEAKVHRLAGANRLAIVPLGPKIFAACALLVGALHVDAVQVIRVSAEERAHAVDQGSDGNVYGLRLVLGAARHGGDIGPELPPPLAQDPVVLAD